LYFKIKRKTQLNNGYRLPNDLSITMLLGKNLIMDDDIVWNLISTSESNSNTEFNILPSSNITLRVTSIDTFGGMSYAYNTIEVKLPFY
jgi:hypothetical protein